MKCKHPIIRQIIKGEYKGTIDVSLVNNLDKKGNCIPAHYKCPTCGKWISYEDRVKIGKE